MCIIGDVSIIKQTAERIPKILVPLFWQKKCCNCGDAISETDKFLCGECWPLLRQCTGDDYCPRCGKNVSRYALLPDGCADCREKSFHFDAVSRAGVYAGLLRSMILKFKLYDATELKPFLAFIAGAAFEGSAFNGGIDFFVPVPLHWSRRFVRGYNQSHLIAKALSGNPAAVNRDLVRIRKTRQQAVLTDAARRANVKDAFAVRKGHGFNNKAVCLVDDIKTSGATLNECARVLKDAGADKVYAAVVAVAGQSNN
ncbi:MAG: hypothetical protein GWO86_02785 [Planctomycetes bacterium]|nr:hypothetical protein [Planctomycetota bacterium]